MDFQSMTDEELDQAIIDASLEREALKEKARALTVENDRRAAVKLVEAMSDEQKAALVGVVGIPSQESVNNG